MSDSSNTNAYRDTLGWEPRVLVVEDDPVCRIAQTCLLERLDLTVDVAGDGREALEMAAAWPYVAIFMDCVMPDIDGYQSTRKIRVRAGSEQSPLVIAVTSHSCHDCLVSGMDHHIAKPLRFDQLRTDCALLGLIAPAPASIERSADGRPDEPHSRVPLLASHAGPTEGITAELVSGFIGRTRLQLPELWRATNRNDAGALLRIALDLRERASRVGADRVAALFDDLADVCRRRDGEAAAALEPRIRRALQQTAHAAGPRQDGSRTLRVAVADDEAPARLAVEKMIRHGDRLELVGSAADVDEMIELVAAGQIDVAVVDYVMPGGGGPAAARGIRERCPDTRVITLTASDTPGAYLEMLRAGASGLLVKGTSSDRLVQLIHRVAERPVA
jgi:CheY-like chemotaxis protein